LASSRRRAWRRRSFEAAVKDGGSTTPGAVLIWDFEDPIHPRYVLEAPADVHCFQFNRSNPRLVAGGLANGRACLWDTSEMMTKNTHERDGEKRSVVFAEIRLRGADSHVCAVTDVRWLGADVAVTKPRGELVKTNPPTGACGFFATTAADGKVLFWDVDVKKDAKKRDVFLTPSYKIKLGRGEQSGTLQAVKFAFSPALRPPARDGSLPENATRFFATSADGEVAQCDFVVPADEEGAPEHTKLCTAAHSQAVRFISRSPFFPDLVMTVGASSFKLWREGCPTPVFSSPQLATRFASCAFSPTRPSVVYVAKEDGLRGRVGFAGPLARALAERAREQHCGGADAVLEPLRFEKKKKARRGRNRANSSWRLATPEACCMSCARRVRCASPGRASSSARRRSCSARWRAPRTPPSARRRARRRRRRAREAAAAAAAAAGGAEEKPRARAKGEREMTEDERREAEYLALEEAFMIEMGLREAPQKEE